MRRSSSVVKEYTYLYVEDDPLSREALSVILTRVMGVKRLYILDDSTDFMARVSALPAIPDLIILDIHMKPLNGFEMLKLLRQDPHYQRCRIVALTASVMNEEVSLLQESGFDGAIGKPIDVGRFPDLIKRILAGESVWHITES
jgi:CheY-like chemotaxis protein